MPWFNLATVLGSPVPGHQYPAWEVLTNTATVCETELSHQTARQTLHETLAAGTQIHAAVSGMH